MNEGTKELTREEIRALAGAVLDVLGVPEIERTDEEREVIRGAIDEYRRRKAAGQKNGEGI